MKKLVLAIMLSLSPLTGNAGSMDFDGAYTGKIKSVGVGFWDHIGVELDGVTKCNGFKEVLLLTSNPLFKVPDRGSVNPTPLGGQGQQWYC